MTPAMKYGGYTAAIDFAEAEKVLDDFETKVCDLLKTSHLDS